MKDLYEIVMKIGANNIRVGNVIEHNGKLWVVLKTMHTQPGKGGAYMQVEMKSIDGSVKDNVRFRSSEVVEKVRLEAKDYQYLYVEGDLVHLMEHETYEQIVIPSVLFSDQLPFLSDELKVIVEFYNDKPIIAQLPDTVIVEIQECEPVVKGQTATSSYKPALLTNGVRIKVPQFLNSGDKIIIKTETREYTERA